jgi:hypothetical protein
VSGDGHTHHCAIESVEDFDIIPHQGVGPIRLGMSRADVHEHFGKPDHVDDAREWFLDGFAVDFDSSGVVEFIELAESTRFKALFNGQSLHELDADDAVALVVADAPFDEDDPELGYTYVFPKMQMSLWRPMIPDTEQSPDDPDGRHFQAIGLGRKGYFDS